MESKAIVFCFVRSESAIDKSTLALEYPERSAGSVGSHSDSALLNYWSPEVIIGAVQAWPRRLAEGLNGSGWQGKEIRERRA
jgi:hypothetical protein